MKKVSKFRTPLLLFGAPALWIAQMSLSEIISSRACYPHHAPLPEPLWAGLPQLIGAIDSVCVIGGLWCAIEAWKEWRNMRGPVLRPHNELQQGCTRFLGFLGMMSSLLFAIAIVFTSCANLLVSPCARWL